MSATADELIPGLTKALGRVGLSEPSDLTRLTGGATMESWRFSADGEECVLRRAPSLDLLKDRPFDHATEAALIRAVNLRGIRAPEIVVELEPEDGVGSGFVMRALPGTADPRAILAAHEDDVEAFNLCADFTAELAEIHNMPLDRLPELPVLDPAEGVAGLREQFEAAGGDRPIIALGLRWLMDNLPDPIEPVLLHGDYRLGNLLVENGALTGVLDWELAHLGDYHEDLAFACMAVWRFARYDRPAFGLGTLGDISVEYAGMHGRDVDPDRFRFWTIYRTVWWALGCLKQAQVWREGQDRMLERVVISRRTSEQELDLLMLLEQDAPEEEKARTMGFVRPFREHGEASSAELAIAISEWLATIKDQIEGHDRFQLAVARNALGMIQRESEIMPAKHELKLADSILAGEPNLETPGFLAELRQHALEKLTADIPKYPALADARRKWIGEH